MQTVDRSAAEIVRQLMTQATPRYCRRIGSWQPISAVRNIVSWVTTVWRGETPSKFAYEAHVAGLRDVSPLLSKAVTADPTQGRRHADAWDHGPAHHIALKREARQSGGHRASPSPSVRSMRDDAWKRRHYARPAACALVSGAAGEGTEEGREMALDRLGQLEARIHESHELSPQQKEELLQLVSELKEAMAELPTTHEAQPPSSTRVPDLAAAETTRQDTPQHPLRRAMDDVSTSVEAFEASHPDLVNTVNQISTLLANMGI
jgi:hypothetical protein